MKKTREGDLTNVLLYINVWVSKEGKGLKTPKGGRDIKGRKQRVQRILLANKSLEVTHTHTHTSIIIQVYCVTARIICLMCTHDTTKGMCTIPTFNIEKMNTHYVNYLVHTHTQNKGYTACAHDDMRAM